jgi:hypothetical protein
MFWNFLVHGRSIGFTILLKLPWSVSLSSFLLGINDHTEQAINGIARFLLVTTATNV